MASLPAGIRHVRPPRPLNFPATDAEGDVGQTKTHWKLCWLLYAILEHAAGAEHTVGADQYVYFDRADLRRCIAPDVFIRLGIHLDGFDSWKIWEKGGPPDACFEILSNSDKPANVSLENKLASYAAMGTREVFTFDFDAAEGTRLRAWDGIGGDLVERVVEGERTPCLSLDCDVVVVANPMEGEPWGPSPSRSGGQPFFFGSPRTRGPAAPHPGRGRARRRTRGARWQTRSARPCRRARGGAGEARSSEVAAAWARLREWRRSATLPSLP